MSLTSQYYKNHCVRILNGDFHSPEEFHSFPRLIRLHNSAGKNDAHYRKLIKILFLEMGSFLSDEELDGLINDCTKGNPKECKLVSAYKEQYNHWKLANQWKKTAEA